MNDAKKLEIKIEINFELLILKFSVSLVNTVFMCN